MTNREQVLMRYICEGDMIGARKYTKAILEGNTAKKDEYFRETMLQKLARTNFLELPENLKNILVAEDSALFPEKKFLVREAEEAIAKKVLSIYRVAGKLSQMGVPYVPALILHGESGCGKTELARYIAYRAKLPFIYVRFSALVNSYLGGTQGNIAKVFDYAKTSPCVLCFDEIDAVGMARGQENDVGEMNRIVIALMQEMDRLPNNMIIIGTTNRFDRLDPALIRRFPIQYEVKKLNEKEAVELSSRLFQYAGLDPACFHIEVWDSVPASTVVQECVNAIVAHLIEQEA